MSEWMDVEEVEAFKPILVSWGNRVRNNLYYLKNIADKTFLADGSRAMQGNIVPQLNATYSLGSSQAQWKYLYVSGDVGEGGIKTNNTSVCENLNADLLDGRHAGNAENQVAVSNGALCSNLNADMLDGKHAHEFSHVITYYGEGKQYYTIYLPREIIDKIYTLQINLTMACFNASTLYVRFYFLRLSDNMVDVQTISKSTAHLRLHYFVIILSNDMPYGRFPFRFLTYRDTSGASETGNGLWELTFYPAYLWILEPLVNTGTLTLYASIVYYYKP